MNQTRQAHPSCSIVVKLGHAVAPMVWSCDGAEDWGPQGSMLRCGSAFWTQHASHRYLATLRGIEFSSLTKKGSQSLVFPGCSGSKCPSPGRMLFSPWDVLMRSGSILGSCDTPELMVLGIPSTGKNDVLNSGMRFGVQYAPGAP